MMRWPVIRHMRWLYHSYQISRWLHMWQQIGIGFGGMNEGDRRHLRAIWDGKA